VTSPTKRRRKYRGLRRGLDVTGSAVFALLVLVASVVGAGPLPALGAVLNTGTGVWRLAGDADRAHPEDVELPGLRASATVSFEDNGLAHVNATDDRDLFQVIGYVHARHRLTQMDLARRQARGELSEVIGPQTLMSDQFQTDLGLRKAAERDWARMPDDSQAKRTLLDYSAGVNAAIAELTREDRLPAMFKLLGYEPREWTPVDSLAIQRVVGQRISFDEQSMVFSYAANALPPDVFAEWFPEIPGNRQHPYDKGPFEKLPLGPLPVRAYPTDSAASGHSSPPRTSPTPTAEPPATQSTDFGPLLERMRALPSSSVHRLGNSNAWAVSGSRTESGGAILANDPHLEYSVPSVWYQIEGRSPGYRFTGVTTPGIPVPLIGKTDDISWGLTASQRPTTLYYVEKTDPAKTDQYFWQGKWQPMEKTTTEIKVRGQAPALHDTLLTAHGPVMQVQGGTVSVWWGGTLPSDNLNSMIDVLRAKSYQEFRASLRGWATPALNFFYADRKGDIGVVNAGIAPQVPADRNPALPMTGDGSADVIGTIPFDALPAAHNPPEGYVSSANQREVSADYPYQYSTSYNYPLQGWRADEVVLRLSGPGKMTAAETARIQNDWHDNYARQLTPFLVRALDSAQLSGVERRVADLMRQWDYQANPDVPQSLFFEPFKNRFTWNVFEPWWKHYGVPQNEEKSLLPTSPDVGSFANETLRGTVVGWLQNDPDNRFFAAPDGKPRDVDALLVDAFKATVADIVAKYGEDVEHLRFDKQEKVRFPSLSDNPALDLGPYPWGGTPRTINASVGTRFDPSSGKPIGNVATGGPTWRFLIDWGTGDARAVYPGGQSENPMSPWYGNGVPLWLKGEYWPVLEGREAEQASAVQWKVNR
jgi:penicillin G amidase